MEPNQLNQPINLPNNPPAQPEQPQPAASNMQMAASMSGQERDKKSRKMLIGIVTLAIIAVIGVGMSIAAFAIKNQDAAGYEKQIATLKSEKADLENSIETETVTVEHEDGTITEVEVPVYTKNPIIKPSDPEMRYVVYLESSYMVANGETNADGYKTIRISIEDGAISDCQLINYDKDRNWLGQPADCTVNGITGDIYKALEFGSGHDNLYDNIGFIMTDGTVKYFPLLDIISSTTFDASNTLKINGYVTSDIEVGVGEKNAHAGGYGATVFILNDGSLVQYSDSLK